MIDENDPSRGIVELRSLDAFKNQKKSIKSTNKKHKNTVNVKVDEVFTYNHAGLNNQHQQGILISKTVLHTAHLDFLTQRKNKYCLIFTRQSNLSINYGWLKMQS